ncbi:MAG TPA: hypothetical protein DDZ79_06065, partial [Aequorivita sp.]|nr:hypothetical protein [Aequorivita sp.]
VSVFLTVFIIWDMPLIILHYHFFIYVGSRCKYTAKAPILQPFGNTLAVNGMLNISLRKSL